MGCGLGWECESSGKSAFEEIPSTVVFLKDLNLKTPFWFEGWAVDHSGDLRFER